MFLRPQRPTLLFVVLGLLAWTTPATAAQAAPAAQPNIVIILADDLGYGDLGCYGATRVKTPHIDRLARDGRRFTDGHCTSATCTPSRYALMTGRYPWRRPGTQILPGDAALIVDTDRVTLPAMLRRAGYTTGCVGKWHLGLGSGELDWNQEIKPGPLEVGFDYSFIIPATVDRAPCVFVEDHRVANLDPGDPIAVSYVRQVGDEPTGRAHPELLRTKLSHGHDGTIVGGISRIGFMSGGKAARWNDETVADTLAEKAIAFVERSRRPSTSTSTAVKRPFFLYLATHDVHVPRTPHPRFAGRSGCGTRGDVIEEFDDTVGQVLAALERLGVAGDTLVMLSSDNGAVLDDGYADGAVSDLAGHRPSGPLKGGKYSSFEGGTRVPLVVRWPARIEPGVSDALVSQLDWLASLAALVGGEIPSDAGLDSQNQLPAFLGEDPRGRETYVEQALGPPSLTLRSGPWKLIPAAARSKRPEYPPSGASPELFDLRDDLGETSNLASRYPERVEAMQRQLKVIVDAIH